MLTLICIGITEITIGLLNCNAKILFQTGIPFVEARVEVSDITCGKTKKEKNKKKTNSSAVKRWARGRCG